MSRVAHGCLQLKGELKPYPFLKRVKSPKPAPDSSQPDPTHVTHIIVKEDEDCYHSFKHKKGIRDNSSKARTVMGLEVV